MHLHRTIATFALTAAALTLSPLTTHSQALHLIPQPRQVRTASTQPIPQGFRIACASCASDADDSFTVQDLTQSLTARHISTAGSFTIQLARGSVAALPAEGQADGYSIVPGSNSIVLTAPSASGLFYAAQTLKQLIENDGSAAALPPCFDH